MSLDPYLHAWLNMAAILVIVGAMFYVSLWGYMD